MRLSGFINFSLALTLFYAWIYFNASLVLNDRIEERIQISNLNSKILNLRQEKQFLNYQIDDLSYQIVASPGVELNSRKPASLNLDELSLQRFEVAKEKARKGDFQRALRDLWEINQKFPRSSILVEAKVLEGDILRAQGKATEAVDIYENIVELYPEKIQAGVALFRLGELAEKNRNFKEARTYFSILVQQFSSSEELNKNALSKIAEIDKKIREAEE